MKQQIDAIYENGLLRPLEPLVLAEREQVRLTVETSAAESEDWLDHDAVAWATKEGDPTIKLDEVRAKLASLPGSLSETITAERGEF